MHCLGWESYCGGGGGGGYRRGWNCKETNFEQVVERC